MTQEQEVDLKLKCLEIAIKQNWNQDHLETAKKFFDWIHPSVLLKSVTVDGNGNAIITEV